MRDNKSVDPDTLRQGAGHLRVRHGNMLIRDFRPGEEAGLRRVFMSSVHELASGFYTKEQLNAWAPHAYNGLHWAGKISSLRPFVAVINGRIAGYADLQASGYIDHFFVSGQFSGRGVGSALIGHIHQAAAQRKISGLSAHVSLSAESFFGKHGFSIVQRQSVMVNGVSMDNALMSRKLQPDIAPNPDAPRAPVSLGVRPP